MLKQSEEAGFLLRGDVVAAEDLLPAVYAELRRLAAVRMAADHPGQTLQPTALVHEAWLRLSATGGAIWQNDRHFLAAASEAMRRILIERARRRRRLKRGGDMQRVDCDTEAIVAPEPDEQLLRIDEALAVLEARDPRLAQIVKLRFFVGLSLERIASLLDLNEKTIRRQLELAKVRLYQALRNEA